MTELLAFAELGFRHIADWAALDHLLFLLALTAPYRAADWRKLVIIASAFTVGHSITLALAVSKTLELPPAVVEFLIPVTIAATAIRNLVPHQGTGLRLEPWFAGGFGLIHGAGFANYLTSLFEGPIAVPLLGFNLGIESGQILILAAFIGAFEVGARILGPRQPQRVVVSVGAGLWALLLAFERLPW